jgi:uncharacterized RDD family membrane protein YckC
VSVAPGWYPDPAEPTTQRYWDGEQWIGEPLPVDAVPQGPPEPQPRLEPPRFAPNVAPINVGRPGAAAAARQPSSGATQVIEVRLATAGHRLAARLIDLTVLLVLNVLVNGYFVYELFREVYPTFASLSPNQTQLPPISERASTLVTIINLLAIALWFAYEVPGLASTGQTPGKRLTGIKVASAPGTSGLGFRRAIVRWAVDGLPCVFGVLASPFLLIDFLWCLWDRPARQCLHDKFAATVVIQAD